MHYDVELDRLSSHHHHAAHHALRVGDIETSKPEFKADETKYVENITPIERAFQRAKTRKRKMGSERRERNEVGKKQDGKERGKRDQPEKEGGTDEGRSDIRHAKRFALIQNCGGGGGEVGSGGGHESDEHQDDLEGMVHSANDLSPAPVLHPPERRDTA